MTQYKGAEQSLSAHPVSHLLRILLGYTPCLHTRHSCTSAYSLYCLYCTVGDKGRAKGILDSVWLEPKSGRELGELLLPIPGTDKLKARVKANPDLNPCASCSHAPSSCPISRSSTHLTFCYLISNVSGLLPRQIQQHNPFRLQYVEAKGDTVTVHFRNIQVSVAESNTGSIQVMDSPLQRGSLEEHNYRKAYWLI